MLPELLAVGEHVEARPAGRELDDPDVLASGTVAAVVGGRFVERDEDGASAWQAHAVLVSRLRSEREAAGLGFEPR